MLLFRGVDMLVIRAGTNDCTSLGPVFSNCDASTNS